MGKIFYYLSILTLFVSCSDNDDAINIQIGNRFTHELPDCDNSGNAEINCTEFLEIRTNGEADLLYGGGDIIRRFKYRIDGNTLYLEQEPTSSFALPFTFMILGNENLERSDNGDIWIKEG
ncbi:MAG: hypothetical protein ACR2MT_08635 [Aurantibacter sp.]